MKTSVGILALILLCGCATLPSVDKQTAAEVQQRSRLKRDEFTKMTVLEGEMLVFGDFGSNNYRLLAMKGDGSTTEYFLRLQTRRVYSQGWAFWRSAHDEQGKAFRVEKVQSEVENAGATLEVVLVVLSRDYLEAVKGSGIKIRVDGDRAQQTCELPPNFIQGFLASVNEKGL